MKKPRSKVLTERLVIPMTKAGAQRVRASAERDRRTIADFARLALEREMDRQDQQATTLQA